REGLGAVGSRDRAHERGLADHEPTHAVAHGRGERTMGVRDPANDLGEDPRGVGVGGVLERDDLTLDARVVVAHLADEGRDGSCARVLDAGDVGRDGDRLGGHCGEAGHAWSPPSSWSSTCGTRGSNTSRPSATPPGEPGRLTTSAPPAVTPARPRERAAAGTRARLSARRASAIPGTSRASTGRVPSGVSSRGPRPVPPLVRTRRTPSSSASRRAAVTSWAPSGTTTTSARKPAFSSRSTASGPHRSGDSPRERRSETTITRALSTRPTYSPKVPGSRGVARE